MSGVSPRCFTLRAILRQPPEAEGEFVSLSLLRSTWELDVRAAHPLAWRGLSDDSPESDSIRTLLFDEPESALSPQRQLALLAHISALVAAGNSQFIITAHSPILLTFPGARILSFDGAALRQTSLEDTSHFQITKGILQNPAVYWKHLQESEGDRNEPIGKRRKSQTHPK